MKLSDGEKLIIAMLADIKKGLNITGEIDDKFVMSAIYSGHLWSLDWDMSGLLAATEPDRNEVKETTDYLDMWDFIEFSYAQLSQADQDRVKAANYNHDPKFPGFDGNHERHYGIAGHLIDAMNRFGSFKGRYINSHSAKVHQYAKMYSVFEPIRGTLGNRHPVTMTADELIQVLNP